MIRTTRYALMLILLSDCSAPSLEPYEEQLIGAAANEAGASRLTVTFLGATTLLFDDGETTFMTDGFFSRPPLTRALHPRSDLRTIEKSLARAGVTSLAAVIPIHSHYDHVLDAPVVAGLTGAVFVGSESSANVARAHELPEERIHVVKGGEVMALGKFRIHVILSRHGPTDVAPGQIKQPPRFGAPVGSYKTGDCFSLLIEHENRAVLVHGSAGFLPDMMEDLDADVVFLGVGALGRQTEAYRRSYWEHVVAQTGARRVILIHWDDFFRPLDRRLVLLPRVVDDFDKTMNTLLHRSAQSGVDVRIPVAWERVDPFADLPHGATPR